jgi:glycosyltransferase involved in cell wall biosynthesis
MGGIGAYYLSLMNSSLPNRINLKFVCTSSQTRSLAQSGNFTFSNLISAIHDCLRFTKGVIQHRPQLTHIATAFGLSFIKHSLCVVIARLLGSRVLLHPHCSIDRLYTDHGKGWRWYFRQVIWLTDGVITLSKEWDALSTIVPGCAVYFLPNAIDLSEFRKIAQERRSRTIVHSPLKIFYLGCLGKVKGTFDLLDAAKEAAAMNLPVIFDLVGEELNPGEINQLQAQIDEAGIGNVISLHPPVIGPAKLDFFREADIFVYPSYSEGMPMAVIEAMASGLPIIATRVGGLPDLVCDGLNGILIEAGSADQFVRAIQKLTANPDIRFAMQLASYQRAVENFDIEALVPRLIDIYHKALSGA